MSCRERYNRRIVVQQVTETQSSSGHPSETWSDYCTRWAKIQPLRGRERFQSMQHQGEVDVRFNVRYDSTTAAITPKMRISYDSRIFNIQAAYDIDEAHQVIEMLAYEVR